MLATYQAGCETVAYLEFEEFFAGQILWVVISLIGGIVRVAPFTLDAPRVIRSGSYHWRGGEFVNGLFQSGSKVCEMFLALEQSCRRGKVLLQCPKGWVESSQAIRVGLRLCGSLLIGFGEHRGKTIIVKCYIVGMELAT